jgi:hypothetical protein
MNSLKKLMRLGLPLLILGVLVFYIWNRFTQDDFNIPRSGETTAIEGEVTTRLARIGREVMLTKDGSTEVRHTIPLGEILNGCPFRDCIPSIDNPTFESVESARVWLDDSAPGIAFSRGGIHRFYAYDILVSHELVNDTVDGERVLISYCPLCLTAVVYDPVVEGERVEFGVSGKLWKSNLIMYDRKTENLWSQVLGEAVLGDLAGTSLLLLPSDQQLFGDWKKTFPNGEVLSPPSGSTRGGNPYAKTHFDISRTALSFAKPTDDRLAFGAHVFGILINGKAKAYDLDAVRDKGLVRDEFEGKTIELRHLKDLNIVRIYEILPDGTEKRINPLSGFWFSWAEAYPDTELYN